MAVAGMPKRANQTLGVKQRPEPLDLIDRNQMAVNADGLGSRAVEPVFVHAVAVHRQAQVASLVKANRLAGLCF